MNKLLKNCWYSKYIIPFIILCGSCYSTVAQHTFFIKIPAFSAYDPDVFEDEKGCIIAKYDFGLTRINPDGRILWQTRNQSLVKGACIKDSQSYIFPASDSEMGGFRIQAIDYKGKTLWMERESKTETRLRTINDFIIDSDRKQYIVAGDRGKVGDFKNLYYWIAGLDYRGNILWEREWRDSGASRYFIKILKNKKTNGYMLLTQEVDKSERKELFCVDTTGKLIDRNFIDAIFCKDSVFPNVYCYLYKENFVEFFEGFIAAIELPYTDKCNNRESGWYYIIYGFDGKIIEKIKFTGENVLTGMTQSSNGDLLGFYYDDITSCYGIRLIDKKLNKKWQKIIFCPPINDFFINFKVIKSKDGGYIGIAGGYTFPGDEYFVYVFKTDSLGNINSKEEYYEKQQPVMLQPNPASNKVRIAIPYYYGTVTVEFYNMQGVFLFQKTKDEQDMYDISGLASGMYIVKARIEETNETRTMRLIVH